MKAVVIPPVIATAAAAVRVLDTVELAEKVSSPGHQQRLTMSVNSPNSAKFNRCVSKIRQKIHTLNKFSTFEKK